MRAGTLGRAFHRLRVVARHQAAVRAPGRLAPADTDARVLANPAGLPDEDPDGGPGAQQPALELADPNLPRGPRRALAGLEGAALALALALDGDRCARGRITRQHPEAGAGPPDAAGDPDDRERVQEPQLGPSARDLRRLDG